MKHLGDITKINGEDVPEVDVITGGSPCQDLSVAGLREGLSGERSGLFFEQIRIIKEMRNKYVRRHGTTEHIRPSVFVWENVQGTLSSRNADGTDDFQTILTEIVRIVQPSAPYVPLFGRGEQWPSAGILMGTDTNGQPFSVAYRLHDAQYWGVPQRRKRIALVASFGNTNAGEWLFEKIPSISESLSRDFEPNQTAGEETSADPARCAIESISFQERAGCAGGGKRNINTK